MKFLNLKNLMASGRQCGVAFIIAAVIHGFLTAGIAVEVLNCPAVSAVTTGPITVEALIIGILGIFLTVLSSIQTGDSQ